MASEKNLNRYSASHEVYSLHYHLETLEYEWRELFKQEAKELNIKIESMEIMPDTSTCPSWHPLPSPHN